MSYDTTGLFVPDYVKVKRCNLCPDATFYSLTNYKEHFYDSHQKANGVYYCQLCWFSSKERKALTTHGQMHRVDQVRKTCPHPSCSFESVTWDGYKDHINTDHGITSDDNLDKTQFECYLSTEACDYTTTDPIDWIRHIIIETKHFCMKCEIRFHSVTSYYTHCKNVHTKKGGRAKMITNKRKLGMGTLTQSQHDNREMFNQCEDGRFKCLLCPRSKLRSYQSEVTIRIHVQNVHGISIPFRCTFSYCKYTTWKKNSLRYHVHRDHHAQTQTRSPSKVNPKVAMAPSIVETQLQIKVEEGKMVFEENQNGEFECPICLSDKLFKTEKSISNHARQVHSIVIPVKCNDCHQMLPSREALLPHMRFDCAKPTFLASPILSGILPSSQNVHISKNVEGFEAKLEPVLDEDLKLENRSNSQSVQTGIVYEEDLLLENICGRVSPIDTNPEVGHNAIEDCILGL